MSSKKRTIVIDNGSGSIKAGFGGSESPNSVFPTIVGRPCFIAALCGGPAKDTYVGDEAIADAAINIIKYPIKNGVVTNWDDMEKIWYNIFNKELKIDSSEHSVLITEHAKNPKANREKMVQIIFETFNVPSFYVGIKSNLSIYAYERTSGIVCDIGDGVSHISPIIENSPLFKKDIRQNIGGRDLTNWLQELLIERGYTFTTTAEMEIVRDIKEKNCYVALDYESELSKSVNKTSDCLSKYTLPDGNVITIEDERFRCPELLFKPHLNGFQLDGIEKVIFDSIMKCDLNVQKILFENIILSGGCTMFDGFQKRIEKQIENLAPQKTKVKVIAMKERNLSAWKGASIFVSRPEFPKMVITHDEYNDNGPGIVHRKCF